MQDIIIDHLKTHLQKHNEHTEIYITTGYAIQKRYYAMSDDRDLNRAAASAGVFEDPNANPHIFRDKENSGIIIEIYRKYWPHIPPARSETFITINIQTDHITITRYTDGWLENKAFLPGLEPPFPITNHIRLDDQQLQEKMLTIINQHISNL